MYEGVVQDLIDELGRLPGVGPKSAQRIAFHILQAEPTDVRRLASALMEVKAKVRFCSVCGNVAQEEQCRVCLDPRRDPATVCVVEHSRDLIALEKAGAFNGVYHILLGRLAPLSGMGPEQLTIEIGIRFAIHGWLGGLRRARSGCFLLLCRHLIAIAAKS